jgi:hypothetical protein
MIQRQRVRLIEKLFQLLKFFTINSHIYSIYDLIEILFSTFMLYTDQIRNIYKYFLLRVKNDSISQSRICFINLNFFVTFNCEMNATKYKFYIQSRLYITFFIKEVYSSLEVKLKYSDNKGILKSHVLIENVPKYPIFCTRSNDFLRQLQSKI